MKTNGTMEAPAPVSQPGNLSVRQLAKSLMQTPATGRTTEATNTTSTTASREEPSPKREEEEQVATENETETSVTDETASTESTETADTSAETDETESTEETPAEENAEEDQGSTESRPTNISEAMAQQINAELAPLIAELNQAGAKGALQILQKRIPKLVDQRDTERNARLGAEDQVAQLRRELQEARSQKPETRSQSGVVHPEVAKVAEELGNVDHWLGWCEANPEGGEVPDGNKGTAELTADQVKQLRTRLERERTEIVARKVQTERDVQAEYQRQYTQHHAAAEASYPWLKNANSPEYQELKSVLQFFPMVKAAPDYELAIGDMIAGRNLRLAKGKATNGTPIRKPIQREPTKVVAEPPASSAARKSPEKAKKDEADSQFQRTGRTSDLAKSFAASRRASRGGN